MHLHPIPFPNIHLFCSSEQSDKVYVGFQRLLSDFTPLFPPLKLRQLQKAKLCNFGGFLPRKPNTRSDHASYYYDSAITLVRNPAHLIAGDKGWCPAGLSRTMIWRSWTHSLWDTTELLLFLDRCQSLNCMSGFRGLIAFASDPAQCKLQLVVVVRLVALLLDHFLIFFGPFLPFAFASARNAAWCQLQLVAVVGFATLFASKLISSLSSLCIMPRPQWAPELFIKPRLSNLSLCL